MFKRLVIVLILCSLIPTSIFASNGGWTPVTNVTGLPQLNGKIQTTSPYDISVGEVAEGIKFSSDTHHITVVRFQTTALLNALGIDVNGMIHIIHYNDDGVVDYREGYSVKSLNKGNGWIEIPMEFSHVIISGTANGTQNLTIQGNSTVFTLNNSVTINTTLAFTIDNSTSFNLENITFLVEGNNGSSGGDSSEISGYTYSRRINVTNNNVTANITSNYTLFMTFNDDQLVTDGLITADCSDVTIWFNRTRQLHRVFQPGFNGTCDSSDGLNATIVWQTQRNITPLNVSQDYHMAYGNASPSILRNPRLVYLFYDNHGDNNFTDNWEQFNTGFSETGGVATSSTDQNDLRMRGAFNYTDFELNFSAYKTADYFDFCFTDAPSAFCGNGANFWDLIGHSSTFTMRENGAAFFTIASGASGAANLLWYNLSIQKRSNNWSFWVNGVFNGSTNKSGWLNGMYGGYRSGAVVSKSFDNITIRQFMHPVPTTYLENQIGSLSGANSSFDLYYGGNWVCGNTSLNFNAVQECNITNADIISGDGQLVNLNFSTTDAVNLSVRWAWNDTETSFPIQYKTHDTDDNGHADVTEYCSITNFTWYSANTTSSNDYIWELNNTPTGAQWFVWTSGNCDSPVGNVTGNASISENVITLRNINESLAYTTVFTGVIQWNVTDDLSISFPYTNATSFAEMSNVTLVITTLANSLASSMSYNASLFYPNASLFLYVEGDSNSSGQFVLTPTFPANVFGHYLLKVEQNNTAYNYSADEVYYGVYNITNFTFYLYDENYLPTIDTVISSNTVKLLNDEYAILDFQLCPAGICRIERFFEHGEGDYYIEMGGDSGTDWVIRRVPFIIDTIGGNLTTNSQFYGFMINDTMYLHTFKLTDFTGDWSYLTTFIRITRNILNGSQQLSPVITYFPFDVERKSSHYLQVDASYDISLVNSAGTRTLGGFQSASSGDVNLYIRTPQTVTHGDNYYVRYNWTQGSLIFEYNDTSGNTTGISLGYYNTSNTSQQFTIFSESGTPNHVQWTYNPTFTGSIIWELIINTTEGNNTYSGNVDYLDSASQRITIDGGISSWVLQLIALILIGFIGLIFSPNHQEIGAIMTAASVGLFSYIRWLPMSTTALALIVIIGLTALARSQKE